MNSFSFPFKYLAWHYGRALLDIFGIAKNYSWAIAHVFSVRILVTTLFVPWHRMKESGAGLFTKPGEFFSNLVVNFILRLIGFVVRVFILTISFILFVLLIALTISVYVGWVALPFSLIYLLISGITLLFI